MLQAASEFANGGVESQKCLLHSPFCLTSAYVVACTPKIIRKCVRSGSPQTACPVCGSPPGRAFAKFPIVSLATTQVAQTCCHTVRATPVCTASDIFGPTRCVGDLCLCIHAVCVFRILRLCKLVLSCMLFIFIHKRLYGCRVEDYWLGYKLFCYAFYSQSLEHEAEFRQSKMGL